MEEGGENGRGDRRGEGSQGRRKNGREASDDEEDARAEGRDEPRKIPKADKNQAKGKVIIYFN